ncbi:MAG: hypothetical protein Q7U03_13835 [Syntrophales bacterium]|nr:hypothetical protein [Syntrophales bacterium]
MNFGFLFAAMIAAKRAAKMFFVGIDLTKFARDDRIDFLQARYHY